MEAGKVVLLEPARLEQNHGQSITEREHGRGARSGREMERAGFLADRDIQHNFGGLAEGGVGAAGHGDKFHVKTGQRREDVEEFRRFPAVAESKDDVAVGDQAEIAVEGVEGIEDNRGGPCAGQGGGNFVADVAGLAHAANHDLAAMVDTRFEGFDRPAEGLAVKVLGQTAQFVRLDADHAACFGQMIHGTCIIPPKGQPRRERFSGLPGTVPEPNGQSCDVICSWPQACWPPVHAWRKILSLLANRAAPWRNPPRGPSRHWIRTPPWKGWSRRLFR